MNELWITEIDDSSIIGTNWTRVRIGKRIFAFKVPEGHGKLTVVGHTIRDDLEVLNHGPQEI